MPVTYHDPLPTNASKRNVSAWAEEIAREIGYDPEGPIETVVSTVGGSISYQNATGDRPESILIEPNESFKIFLPTLTSMGRDKFTIAHELGHYFLHFPLVQARHPSDGMRAYRWLDENTSADLKRCEWEANWFAAAFVMPDELFRELHSEGGVEEVSHRFGVSMKAAQVRAQSLGLPD
jgi:Zn-dependent peptidase ImmA (M78 family)